MFLHTNKQDARVTHGRYKRLIVESETATPNADMEFEEGYLDPQGEFVSMGMSKIHLQDSLAELNEDGTIKTPASTDYSDFMTMLSDAFINKTDKVVALETFLQTKGA